MTSFSYPYRRDPVTQLTSAADKTPVYYECGICGHCHPWTFNGDCRDDANRFTHEQLDSKHGGNWECREMGERVAADMRGEK